MTGTLGVGVVGLGAMGAAHVRTLTEHVPGARVVVVHDADPARAATVAAASGARTARAPADVVADAAVSAVVVASPDETHAELALDCVAAGKPVLCEKPLGTGPAESAQVVAAESAAGRRLVTVGFMRRFDPAYRELRDAVGSGAVGRPLLVHNIHRNAAPHPSLTSDGVVANAMVHELDVLPWLLGGTVTAVHVRSPRRGTSEGLRDLQIATVEIDDGRVLATVEVFMSAGYGYDIRCEVVGTDGSVELAAPIGAPLSRDGRRGVAVPADFRARFAEAYRWELLAWVQAARGGGATGASAWEGHLANLAAAAGVSSSRTGERVEVPPAERPALYA